MFAKEAWFKSLGRNTALDGSWWLTSDAMVIISTFVTLLCEGVMMKMRDERFFVFCDEPAGGANC